MERQFNNGDFERLLRDNANQYRMYPSEKVWKGVQSALHTRRRWYGLTVAIVLLITGAIVSIFIFYNNPGNNNVVHTQNVQAENEKPQPGSLVSTNEKQNEFTPELKNDEPVTSAPKISTHIYLNVPSFNLPVSEENKQPDENSLIQAARSNNDDVSVTNIEEEENQKSANNNLFTAFVPTEHVNSRVQTETAGSNNDISGTDETISENTVDNATEKRIAEAVSALSSQNVSINISKKQAKLTAQVFFTPTISYRKLTENKNVYTGSGLAYMPTFDLNNVVKHKPAMGLEFGIESRYRLNNKLFLKAGLQFNISRYDIRASSYPTEIATVAVTNGFRVDSLATLSNYRNVDGHGTNWLENFYFQAAFPVGLELILSENKNKNIQWGISGTVQPTYVIGDRAYVISSDYKNYAKFPDLMRRWNLSTGAGAFIQYSTGKIRWQAGPHVRYQHLSSFVSELTVKEKLFSVGLKVGATLNKK